MRQSYSLDNYQLGTGKLGQLIPVGVQEVLPGDSFTHRTSLLVRLMPMAAPVMHPMQVRIHHWFVPNRLVWDGWEDFITGGPDGNDASTPPTVLLNAASKGGVLDYMGCEAPDTGSFPVNGMPLAGYNFIFNEFYRDQDLVAERSETDQTLAQVAWEKDMFTTARPWALRGDPTTVPIDVANENFALTSLRYQNAIDRFKRRRGRWGARYTEYLQSEFGIRPEDVRLDRPEYLGGGKTMVSTSEVLQTAPEVTTALSGKGARAVTEYGVGDMYGHGIAASRILPYRKRFQEHGYVHTLLSVRPKALYVNGADRHFFKQFKDEYYQRDFAAIGQQEVFNGEVKVTDTQNRFPFGYQDRYREYREGRSHVTGAFRDLLNYWHMGRDFAQRPVLNSSFVTCDPSDRVFNVQGEDTIYFVAEHAIAARRPVQAGGIGNVF